MAWQKEIDELDYRRHLAERMGGPEGVERQHARGKLTVRERIAALADPGSFQEIGPLAGSARYDGDKVVAFTPANYVIGLCTLNGHKVVVNGGDFTVRGGAADAAIGNKSKYAEKLVLDWRLAQQGNERRQAPFLSVGGGYVPHQVVIFVIASRSLCTLLAGKSQSG